jgi:hypothetical protein
MTSEEFIQTDQFQQLREHAYRENDVMLHNLMRSLMHQPDLWVSAEAFLTDAVMLMSSSKAEVMQQLIDAVSHTPTVAVCACCIQEPTGWV